MTKKIICKQFKKIESILFSQKLKLIGIQTLKKDRNMYEVVVLMSDIAMKVLNPPWKTAEPMSRRAFLDLPALTWKMQIVEYNNYVCMSLFE